MDRDSTYRLGHTYLLDGDEDGVPLPYWLPVGDCVDVTD